MSPLPTAIDGVTIRPVAGPFVPLAHPDTAALASLREAVREIVQTYDTWQAAEATGPITWREFDEIHNLHNLCAAFWTAFRDNVPRLRALVEET